MKNKYFNVQLSSVRMAFFGKASLHQTSQPSKEDSVKLPKEVCAKSLQSCPTLRNPMDCSLPGSSVLRDSPSRILEWVARPSSRGSSWPRNQTHVSSVSCTGRQILYHQRRLGSLDICHDIYVNEMRSHTLFSFIS